MEQQNQPDPVEAAKAKLADIQAKIGNDIGYYLTDEIVKAFAILQTLSPADYVRFLTRLKDAGGSTQRLEARIRQVTVRPESTKKRTASENNTPVEGGIEDPIRELNNCYYYYFERFNKLTNENEPIYRKLTNFVFSPQLFLKNEENASYRCTIETENGVKLESREFSLDAFVSVKEFNKALALDYTLSFSGTVTDLGIIKAHISNQYADLKEIKQVHVLGQVKGLEGCLLSQNEILTCEGFIDSEGAGIAYSPKGFNQPRTLFSHDYHFTDDESKNLARQVLELLKFVTEQDTFFGITGWFFALPFKPLITHKLQTANGSSPYWPFLHPYGSAGSGKTNLVRLYQALFGIRDATISVTGSTPHATLQSLGYSESLPVFFDEYNRRTPDGTRRCDQLDTHLRDAYNQIPAYKGNIDLTSTRFDRFTPLIIAGESCVEDTAVLGRVIAIEKRAGFTAQNIESYKALQQLDQAAFATIYLQWSLKQCQDEKFVNGVWLNANHQAREAVEKYTLNTKGHSELDRVAANMAVMVFGLEMFRFFAYYVGFNLELFNYKTIVGYMLKPILDPEGNGNIAPRVKNQADEFIEFCANNSLFFRDCVDWPVLGRDDGKEIIYINFPLAFAAFELSKAKTRYGTFGAKSIKSQLREREYILQYGDGQHKFGVKGSSQNRRCYEIDAVAARAAGLDIPPEPPEPPEPTQDEEPS